MFVNHRGTETQRRHRESVLAVAPSLSSLNSVMPGLDPAMTRNFFSVSSLCLCASVVTFLSIGP